MPQKTPQKPQLTMKRPDLKNLPEITLPDGYELRTFQPGDERAWEAIVARAFDRDVPEGHFDSRIGDHDAFQPERVFFICHNGEGVATATAWYMEKWGENTGYVHMVGVKPGHQGKRLGYQVSLAVLHRLRGEGFEEAVLTTDDFRLPAIKTYLNLGFEPVLVHENQRERWRDVFEALGMPELAEKYSAVLNGPVHSVGSED
ncbi:MAG: GNAT family N-acetyltransferase [Armatimonadota bacterium]